MKRERKKEIQSYGLPEGQRWTQPDPKKMMGPTDWEELRELKHSGPPRRVRGSGCVGQNQLRGLGTWDPEGVVPRWISSLTCCPVRPWGPGSP